MSGRIHLIIEEREREAFRASAAAEGISLSEWLREAARERLDRGQPKVISSTRDLDRFFAERAIAEAGEEPDWQQHESVMDQSRRAGLEPS